MKKVATNLDANNKREEKRIKEYYRDINMEAVFPHNVFSLSKIILKGGKNRVMVSPNRTVRGFAKLRGMKYVNYDKVKTLAWQYLALKEAMLILNRKEIPCYFYNRVGKMTGFEYGDSCKRRMQEKLSFPKMYENIKEYEDDFRELIGEEKYSVDYVKALGEVPQIVFKGNIYSHEDYKSELINVVGGRRITVGQPDSFSKTIHLYGRCGAFGYAVEDSETMSSQLQKLINDNGYDIRVINHGLWGGDDTCIDHNFLHDVGNMKQGDIVIFYRMHYNKGLLRRLEEAGLWYKEITEDWHKHPEAKWCFYDRPGHMNRDGYRIAAKLMFEDLVKHEFAAKPVKKEDNRTLQAVYLNEYIKGTVNSDFIAGIEEYVNDILVQHPVGADVKKCGSIVMNCNPFTKGHRYLIEYASKRVDRLYIFVVEEDRSFFNFKDRWDMVVEGTKDISNVVVVPSGRFIISSLTFPEYFLKDYVKEKNFDVSMDIDVFCRYIAPKLNISMRFAGEEPFDPITCNYNENMQRILPMYNMEFCEIPRLEVDGVGLISATEVRRLMKDKKNEEIKKYVPETTYKVLEEKYLED